MPRLTDETLLRYHQELHAVWSSGSASVFLLEATEQWALHEYFRFTESLSRSVLLEHRRAVSVDSGSLPQCAGRAFAKWRVCHRWLEAYRAIV